MSGPRRELGDEEESVFLEVLFGILLCLLGAGGIVATIKWGQEDDLLTDTLNQLAQAVLIAGLLDLILSSALKRLKRRILAPVREFRAKLDEMREIYGRFERTLDTLKIWTSLEDMNQRVGDQGLKMLDLELKVHGLEARLSPPASGPRQEIG